MGRAYASVVVLCLLGCSSSAPSDAGCGGELGSLSGLTATGTPNSTFPDDHAPILRTSGDLVAIGWMLPLVRPGEGRLAPVETTEPAGNTPDAAVLWGASPRWWDRRSALVRLSYFWSTETTLFSYRFSADGSERAPLVELATQPGIPRSPLVLAPLDADVAFACLATDVETRLYRLDGDGGVTPAALPVGWRCTDAVASNAGVAFVLAATDGGSAALISMTTRLEAPDLRVLGGQRDCRLLGDGRRDLVCVSADDTVLSYVPEPWSTSHELGRSDGGWVLIGHVPGEGRALVAQHRPDGRLDAWWAADFGARPVLPGLHPPLAVGGWDRSRAVIAEFADAGAQLDLHAVCVP